MSGGAPDGINKYGHMVTEIELTQPAGGNVVRWLPNSIMTLAAQRKTALSLGSLVRGVVIAVYEPDDTSAARSPAAVGITTKVSPWLCDVQIFEGTYRGILPRVPIMTTAFGMTDMVQWVPRASTRDVRLGQSIQLESSVDPVTGATSKATSIDDQDGDVVIVAFLDNNYNKPIIVGALPSVSTLKQISVNDNPKYKWQAVVRGNLIGIQDGGQIDIDCTGQTTGVPTATGDEPAVSNATIVIKSNGSTVTIDEDGVKIEATIGQATEIIKEGTGLKTFSSGLSDTLTELISGLSALGIPATNTAALKLALTSGDHTTSITKAE